MIEYMLFTVHWQSVTDWRHNSYKSLQVNKPCTNFPLKKAGVPRIRIIGPDGRLHMNTGA